MPLGGPVAAFLSCGRCTAGRPSSGVGQRPAGSAPQLSRSPQPCPPSRGENDQILAQEVRLRPPAGPPGVRSRAWLGAACAHLLRVCPRLPCPARAGCAGGARSCSAGPGLPPGKGCRGVAAHPQRISVRAPLAWDTPPGQHWTRPPWRGPRSFTALHWSQSAFARALPPPPRGGYPRGVRLPGAGRAPPQNLERCGKTGTFRKFSR